MIHRLSAIFQKRGSSRVSDQETAADEAANAPVDKLPGFLSPIGLRQAYLNSLIAYYRPFSIPDVQFNGNGPAGNFFLLDRFYIPPDTRSQTKEVGPNPVTDESHSVPMISVIATDTSQRLIVTGGPGSGKSLFLIFLALQHARALTSSEMTINELLPDWPAAPLLPVLIPIPRVAAYLTTHQSSETDLIESYLRFDDRSQSYSPYLFEETDRIGGLYLFDGLDEIPDPSSAPLIIQAIQSFASRHSGNLSTRFIITCRDLSYRESCWKLDGWTEYELAPFTEVQIRKFVEAWYDELIRLDPPRRAYHEIKRAKLLSFFRAGDPNRLLDLAANPLFLTGLIRAHVSQDGLPDNRIHIYRECLAKLILNWKDEERREYARLQPERLLAFLKISSQILERALQEIAYLALASQSEDHFEPEHIANVAISEADIRTVLRSHLNSNEQAESALLFFRQIDGIFNLNKVTWHNQSIPDGESEFIPEYSYAFLHPATQEYLAALHLSHKADLGLEARQHLNRGNQWWEVLLLLGDILCQQDASHQRMDSVLNALAPAPIPQEGLTPAGWRAIWLAGEMLPNYRRAYPDQDQEHRHIPRGLVNLMQARGSYLPAKERASAGDALDSIGDPRFRPDAWYLPDEALFGFLLIPAGSFYMGSNASQDPAARDLEQPQHILDLPDYFIARYLVTVAQFKAFVEATRYQPANQVSLHGRLSRPVVYVSWHDAFHYCEWLTNLLKGMAANRLQQWAMNETERSFWQGLADGDLVATLPSEAEWEKAARGSISNVGTTLPPQRFCTIYPWGNEFDANKANTAETGLGGTSPVGCFPTGASTYGVLDMVGNVWEWTRSIWGSVFAQPDFDYPYTPSVERENLQAPDNILRVIRGGSFFYHNWHTRTSSRGRSTPPEWDWDIGFRVVVTSQKYSHYQP